MRKRKFKKRELQTQIASDLEILYNSIEETKHYKFNGRSKDGGVAVAVLMYDINRYSARILALLRAAGLPLKLDIDYMAILRDDPFSDELDPHKHIKLLFEDLEEKN